MTRLSFTGCLCIIASTGILAAESPPLFHIDWGRGSHQLGYSKGGSEGRIPDGISSFAVGEGGIVIISDPVNRAVKIFRSQARDKKLEILFDLPSSDHGDLEYYKEHIYIANHRGVHKYDLKGDLLASKNGGSSSWAEFYVGLYKSKLVYYPNAIEWTRHLMCFDPDRLDRIQCKELLGFEDVAAKEFKQSAKLVGFYDGAPVFNIAWDYYLCSYNACSSSRKFFSVKHGGINLFPTLRVVRFYGGYAYEAAASNEGLDLYKIPLHMDSKIGRRRF